MMPNFKAILLINIPYLYTIIFHTFVYKICNVYFSIFPFLFASLLLSY